MKPLSPAVLEFITAAPVCRIATVQPDGTPHLIPVCPVFDGQSLYVDIGPRSTTARALAHDARITVLIDEYYDDWSHLRKVILRCHADEITGAARDAVWERIREKFPQFASVNWRPRQTLALHIDGVIVEGFPE